MVLRREARCWNTEVSEQRRIYRTVQVRQNGWHRKICLYKRQHILGVMEEGKTQWPWPIQRH
jgi:hypothetical protein